MKKTVAIILSALMVLASFAVICIYAGGESVGAFEFEESFDDYQDGVAANLTKLGEQFSIEANSIGDGYVKVREDQSGNLYLESHVFTDIHSKDAIKGAYTFSMDILEMQGGRMAALFIRAPKNSSAYYEACGGDPDHPESTSKSGMLVYVSDSDIAVNIKTFDKSASGKVKDNTVSFALPEGVKYNTGEYVNLRIEDADGEVSVYAADTLICRAKFTDASKKYSVLGIGSKCYSGATLYDAAGNTVGEYQNTLVMGEGSIVGWATRCANMSVDNVKLSSKGEEAATDPGDPGGDIADMYGKLVVNEGFDGFEADVGGTLTSLADKFTLEANSIGDGYIKVTEAGSGNLFLRSCVFTQIFNKDPVTDKYSFSLDIIKMDGGHAAGVFVRAPKNSNAYYEADGDPDFDRSLGQTGMYIYVSESDVTVNVKSYVRGGSNHTKNNDFSFNLPAGVKFSNNGNDSLNLRIDDDGQEICVYAGGFLICKVKMSEPGNKCQALNVVGTCFGQAVICDAAGNQVGEINNPLLMDDGSYFGWATRVATLDVDNVKLSVDIPNESNEDTGCETLPDNSPMTEKPEMIAETKDRAYPWLEFNTSTYKYDFTSTDIKTYSQDANLASASLRTGMKFDGGTLSCVPGKSYSFGSGVFLGDNYGISGGTLQFDMLHTGGRMSVGTRLSKKAADNSKLGIWFTFENGKVSVCEPISRLKATVALDTSVCTQYEIADAVDRMTLKQGGNDVLLVTYGQGGAINIYTPDGKWLGGTATSNVNPAGYFTFYAENADGYIDNVKFSHAEITDKTVLSGDHVIDYSTWVATDDRERTTPTGDSTGAVKSEKQVGVFYFVSLTGADCEEPLDNTKLFLDLGIDGLKQYYESGHNGAYYWAEPYFGYYKNTDAWVYRKHAYMLEAAGVDFIYVDLTNGATYPAALTTLFDTWLEMRREGIMTPDIAIFAGNSGDSTNASLTSIRGLIYSDENWEKYSELFYIYDGKPLMLVGSNEGLTDDNYEFLEKFTVKTCWAWQNRTGWWSWIQEYINHEDGTVEYVNGGPGTDADGNFEALALMIGHHATTNKGRSFADGVFPDTSAEDFGFSLDSGAGTGFAAQWEAVKKLDPKLILLCGWNEWTAGLNYDNANETFSYMGGTHVKGYGFIDQFNTEYSRDAEPMKMRQGESVGFGDNYYYQMVSIIREFKGMDNTTEASGQKTVDITKPDEWASVGPEYRDSVGDTAYRSAEGYFAGYTYVNNSGRNDFDYAKVSQDAKYLYFTVKCVNDIVSDDGANWMNLFLNTDGDMNNGWEGYDFVLNRARDKNYVSIESLANGWSGAHIAQALYKVNGQYMTIRVDKSVIGLKGEVRTLLFKWADNSTVSGNVMEFMDLGDTAPNDRFAYKYVGSQSAEITEIVYKLTDEQGNMMDLRDESKRLPGTPEPSAEQTLPISDETSEQTTVGNTEPDQPGDNFTGCGSTVGGVLTLLTTFGAAAVVKKKKNKRK